MPERQINFTVFAAAPVATLEYQPLPAAASVPLVFYPTARSQRYSYAGPEALIFRHALTGAVMAQITVPSDVKEALFILVAQKPSATSRDIFSVHVIDETLFRRAPDSLTILNLSGLPLAGTVNGNACVLSAGLNAAVRVGGVAAVTLRTPFRSRSYQAYAETIPVRNSTGALLVLLPPYRAGSLEVQSRVLLDNPTRPGADEAQE
ncbi:MAG: hypothetical protein ABI420_15780 [Opitutaceae bacterium]